MITSLFAQSRNLAIATMMLVIGTSTAAAQSTQASSEAPNIVFFIVDDMFPHHFNFLNEGEKRVLTPNIDRLAREGTVMLNQYTVSPLCTPSRYSCLMGRYPSRATNPWFLQTTEKNVQSYVEFNTHIEKDNQTLPRMLQAGGYITGMAGKNHVIEAKTLKKFENFDADAKLPENQSKLKANHDHVCQAIREVGFDFADSIYHNNPDFLGLHEVAVHNTDWITEAGINFIDKGHTSEKPMFLYFATTLPHGPSEGHRAWDANPLISAVGYLDEAPNVQPARHTIPERIKAAGITVNDDTCNLLWLDDALGALINKLEDCGELDNTVIYFFNDQWMEAKGTVYEGGVHTPSIVWKKGGFTAGSTSSAMVSSVDFAPTILDMAKIPYDSNTFDGESFLPYLDGQTQEPGRVLYFELGYGRGVLKDNWKFMSIRYPHGLAEMSLEERTRLLNEWNAERHRKHLEIVTEDPTAPFSHLTAIPGGGHAESISTGKYPGYADPDQLYNIAKDPGELNNLANNPEFQQKAKEMELELQKYLDTLPGTFEL
ncbi:MULTISPECIES: sulfatase [unclassified Lentimonas]|uniref:sulfatase family protein n=1 Tax=unclassified Lentimonas TaxID=2630993 RepID=UPI0013271793|nr:MULTISPECIES: sulfatase-like hydrolase/transferase [unclassified Lentimonas]CAA6679080.1 Unannotated [Lentimonas sp. CC4]CAA6684180.1 Unannotated [Lentimonas sp. CC6]CAA7076447.1 Unannotated [Lentimonas sp. CC4]CAA7170384.1 Unannotated [Lentimonas sp. CC21]CAA7182843.1 Unannotated [Lentimonas sp. CC8]